jgi:hypothetical protein
MRARSRGALWLTCCCLVTGIGVALSADRSGAQLFEYVITFDNVVVQDLEGVPETPAIAHLDPPTVIPRKQPAGVSRDVPGGDQGEQPGAAPREPLGWEKPSSLADPEPDASKGTRRPDVPLPRAARRPLESLKSVPPGRSLGNPSFIQEGFLVEAFWAVHTGSSDAYFKRAHFHPPDLSTGFEAQHLGNPTELHGIFIRSVDGKRFGLKSLRYRVTRNRQIPDRPISIEGFSNFNVSVLVARSVDPPLPTRSQFLSFPVGLPVGNNLSLPWFSLRIFGFELVEQLYLASSASVDFDNIVLTRSEPPPAPPDQSENDK